MVLSNVLWCPTAGVNLISASQLYDKNATLNWSKAGLDIVTPDRRTTFHATQRNGLWALDLWRDQFSPLKPLLAFKAYSLTDKRLMPWHERMGHIGEQNLRKLANMPTEMNLNEAPSCTCEPCVQGRMKENPHKRGNSSILAIKPLECLHMDLCGPFPVTGWNGCRYWLSIICESNL